MKCDPLKPQAVHKNIDDLQDFGNIGFEIQNSTSGAGLVAFEMRARSVDSWGKYVIR